MPKPNTSKPPRTLPINGVWYDSIADDWYKYPATRRRDPDQTPAIFLVGSWLVEAGFPPGRKVDVSISPSAITLTLRK